MDSSRKKIFIWGAGGQGRVVLDILRENKNFEIVGFIDSNKKLKGKIVDGVEVLGDKSVLKGLHQKGVQTGIVAIGTNTDRCEVADYLRAHKFHLVNAIHPRAFITSNVVIGSNVTITAGAIICVHTVVGDDVIINTGAIVDHHSIIGKGVHIAPGAKLAGGVEIGGKAFIGIGAVIIQYLKIGNNSIIGAGSVVLKDIPDRVVAVGVPARVIKKIK